MGEFGDFVCKYEFFRPFCWGQEVFPSAHLLKINHQKTPRALLPIFCELPNKNSAGFGGWSNSDSNVGPRVAS